MDLTVLIDQAKSLTESLQVNIQKCKDRADDLYKQSSELSGQKAALDDATANLRKREARVSGIENAQNILMKADQRNKDAEEKQVELFDREKLLAESEVKLDDNLKKLVRDRDDLHRKNKDLTRDWTIFNQEKKDYEKKVKSFV